MKLYSKLLVNYYLIAANSSPTISPYIRSIVLIFLSQFFSGLLVIRILDHFCNGVIMPYAYIVMIVYVVWLGILTLIYPENKMPDLIEEFKKQNGDNIKFWKIISILFLIVPSGLLLLLPTIFNLFK